MMIIWSVSVGQVSFSSMGMVLQEALTPSRECKTPCWYSKCWASGWGRDYNTANQKALPLAYTLRSFVMQRGYIERKKKARWSSLDPTFFLGRSCKVICIKWDPTLKWYSVIAMSKTLEYAKAWFGNFPWHTITKRKNKTIFCTNNRPTIQIFY